MKMRSVKSVPSKIYDPFFITIVIKRFPRWNHYQNNKSQIKSPDSLYRFPKLPHNANGTRGGSESTIFWILLKIWLSLIPNFFLEKIVEMQN